MRALPPSPPAVPAEEITGLGCPECYGVLNVSTEGPHETLRFRCRIGHLYSTDDVLMAKERLVEEHLWAAVTALSELTVFLRELVTTGRARPNTKSLEERAASADEEQREIRGIIERNEPVELGHDEVDDEGVK